LCIYRIAQEALSNTLKHSGANYASLALSKTTDGYYMMIKDVGLGFDMGAPSEGLGLISMKERLNLFKGRFTVNSLRGHGTELAITIPFQEDRDSPRPASM
jgi:two-component system, NarL family, sensor histidine kinase UhpB